MTVMKDSFHSVLWLILSLLTGIFVGTCVSPFSHSEEVEVRHDTTFVYDTVKHSRLELAAGTYRLDIPKVGMKEYVYVREDSVSVIYIDSVRYVSLPREYRYTKTEDAEIWHSGVDSRIDSLNVFRKTLEITERHMESRARNRVGVGVEATYYNALYVPAYIEYERMIRPWFSVYGRVGYYIPNQDVGISLGMRLQVEF